MKFSELAIGDHFVITDNTAPYYMRGVLFEKTDAYQDPETRIIGNAEKVVPQGDLYDRDWISEDYTVEER